MNRGDLTDREWERLQPLLPPQKPDVGRPAKDHRTIINGILWILRTGAPWRDLPKLYGKWKTVVSRFYRWRKAGIWQHAFAKLQEQADADGKLDWDKHYVDGTVIRAHQHAAGAKGGSRKQRASAVARAVSPQSSIFARRAEASP
jgi:transposase